MDSAHSHSNSSCYALPRQPSSLVQQSPQIPRDNLTTIFDSHNDPQSRRWGTSYVRRWGTRSSSLTCKRSAVYWMGDISWPRYALGIPFGLLSASWTFTHSHSFLIIYLSNPLIPASRSILGPNLASMPSSADVSRYLVMLTVTRFPHLRLRGLMIV